MSTPYLGEVKITACNFAQKGWAFCNGQLLPVNQNQALFALLGTNFGGDGQTTFGLPNLSGCTPIGWGTGANPPVTYAQSGGEANHTLTTNEMPSHTHQLYGSGNAADSTDPDGGLVAVPGAATYLQATPNSALSPASIGQAGGGQGHDNMQPYLGLNFVIAVQGIYPPRP